MVSTATESELLSLGVGEEEIPDEDGSSNDFRARCPRRALWMLMVAWSILSWNFCCRFTAFLFLHSRWRLAAAASCFFLSGVNTCDLRLGGREGEREGDSEGSNGRGEEGRREGDTSGWTRSR